MINVHDIFKNGAATLVAFLFLSTFIISLYVIIKRHRQQLALKDEQINALNKLHDKLLQEKEWLIQEIHHRVRNNLQIVISLLNSQSVFLDNQDAIDAIRSSQHRMHALSLMHQKLYQTHNLTTIDMCWYIRELVEYLKENIITDTQIQFHLNTEELELDVALAIPVGLILNEAVSNAIKYAFPNSAQGIIGIELKKQTDTLWRLRIFDNGIGLPLQFDIEVTASLGMSLMRGLSEQLDASFHVQGQQGTVITIIFPVITGIGDKKSIK
jgi:two-component sensor histidine kinase